MVDKCYRSSKLKDRQRLIVIKSQLTAKVEYDQMWLIVKGYGCQGLGGQKGYKPFKVKGRQKVKANQRAWIVRGYNCQRSGG